MASAWPLGRIWSVPDELQEGHYWFRLGFLSHVTGYEEEDSRGKKRKIL